ncbi:MAG: DUF427 domain-containing protein [Pseudomonadota bacterium]
MSVDDGDGLEPPAWIKAAQARWSDAVRPRDIVRAGPGQESVWDYPRPPRLEREARPIKIEFSGQVIAESPRAMRICETASPPTYYLPPTDVDLECLVAIERGSVCEWKGEAAYFDVLVDNRRAPAAVWSYPNPFRPFGAIGGWFAFMPAAMDRCWVGDALVRAQPGGFYGGWITPELTGPFKGEPGTGHW